jgi:hypothetical protein
MRRNCLVIWTFFLLLSGCSPNSLEDYQYEGEALCRVLVRDLRKIRSREQLLKAEPQLKKRFDQVVDLMIEARQFQQRHSEENGIDPTAYDHPYSEQLLEELKRIYSLEGGRKSIERVQREALIRLDAFERSLVKEKQMRIK